MLRHVIVFACVLATTAILVGCGGRDERRQTGTSDMRIVGEWLAREITYRGQTQSCPGEIREGSDTVACSGTSTFFTDNGRYTVGATTDEYWFDGTTLILYNRAGNAAQFGVIFSEADNTMTWSWNQNGQPATIVVDRVLLED